GMGGEVVEPHLDTDRSPHPLLAGERAAELGRKPVEDGLERIQPAQVGVEGRLPRLRLGYANRLDLAAVLETGEPGEVQSEALAERPRQVGRRCRRELAEGLDPALPQPVDR